MIRFLIHWFVAFVAIQLVGQVFDYNQLDGAWVFVSQVLVGIGGIISFNMLESSIKKG